jgi:L-asparaginase/beta-aspartyl-peptidase (threonine type)
VGAVARDANGALAVATSTGGTATMLLGRVGDSPIIGCGLYAGPHGAVSVTGEGEEILVRMMARAIHDRLGSGASPEEACRDEVATFLPDHVTGAIALTPDAWGWAANRHLPVATARP